MSYYSQPGAQGPYGSNRDQNQAYHPSMNNGSATHGNAYNGQMSMMQPAFAHNAAYPMQNYQHQMQNPMAHQMMSQAGMNQNFDPNSPQFAAARQQVMKQMASSNQSPTLHNQAPAHRGDGVHMGGYAGSTPQSFQTTPGMSPPAGATPTRGRGRGGRPRGSGVGRGRGGRKKRRREDDASSDLTPSEEDKSDTDSKDPNAFPLVTKSGRSVQKPTTFNPLPANSPSSRKKKGKGKGDDAIQCAKCLRGHSPPSNPIVMCDGCNEGYHQWCHDPPIPANMIEDITKTWFCHRCKHVQEVEAVPIERRVSRVSLTNAERERYLSTLSSDTLLALLMKATTLHPDLPIFPPARNDAPDNGYPNTNPTAVLQSQMNLSNTSSAHHTMAAAPIRQSTSTLQSSAPDYYGYGMSTQQAYNRTYPTAAQPMAPKAPTDAEADSPSPSPAPSTIGASIRGDTPASYDPYPDHSNAYGDPPATYPRPGAGPYPITPLTKPGDLNWMLDDNNQIYSHRVNDGHGGLVPLERTIPGAKEGQRGEWVGKGDVSRLRYGLPLQGQIHQQSGTQQ